jgi:hypothetical protein
MTDLLMQIAVDGDLLLTDDGDLLIGDSVVQHQRDVVLMAKGWNRYAPTLGVGAEDWLLDTDEAGLRAACRVELQRDGLPASLADTLTSITIYNA